MVTAAPTVLVTVIVSVPLPLLCSTNSSVFAVLGDAGVTLAGETGSGAAR